MTKNEFSRPVVLANIPRSGQRESLAAIMDKLAAAAGQLDEQAMREGAAVKGRRLGLGRKMRGAAGQDA